MLQVGRQAETGSRLEQALMQVLREVHPECAQDDALRYMLERTLLTIEDCRNELSAPMHWVYLRVSHVNPARYAEAIQRDILPAIEGLSQVYPVDAWWWLSKRDSIGAAIRLRVAVPPIVATPAALDLMERLSGKGYDLKILRYEPELRLFGGNKGQAIAHELFFRDSEFLARWAQCEAKPRYPFIPIGLSLAIMTYLTGAAGLDNFERWDVFGQLAEMRPLGPDDHVGKLQEYEVLANKVISVGPDGIFALFRGAQAEILGDYLTRVYGCGRAINQAFFNGELECGLREFLVPVLIFHMNRSGMPWTAQTRMAHAMKDAFQRLGRGNSGRQTNE